MTSIINSPIPEFKVQAYHNGVFKTVSNEDIKGKWAIFFFYPADFTFVCPTELVDMAEKYEQFKAMGVEVYSVSTDSHFVHKAWHDTSESIRKIQYPMLADPTGVLARGFGVMSEEDGMAYRGTFVVNPEGVVKLVEIQDNSIGRNAEELAPQGRGGPVRGNAQGRGMPRQVEEGRRDAQAEHRSGRQDLRLRKLCWTHRSRSNSRNCSGRWRPTTSSTSQSARTTGPARSCSNCSATRPPHPTASPAA